MEDVFDKWGIIHAKLDRFAESVQYVGKDKNEHCTVSYHKHDEAFNDSASTWVVEIYNHIQRSYFTFCVSCDDYENIMFIHSMDGCDVWFDVNRYVTSGAVPDKVVKDLQEHSLDIMVDSVNMFFTKG